MNEREQNIRLGVAIVGVVSSIVMMRAAIKIQDREHARRMKEVEELGKRVRAVNKLVEDTLKEVSAKIEVVRFWEQVTGD